MTNQGNVSSPESAWDHGYKRGKEDRKRKTKKVKKCLHKAQQRTQELANALENAGLPVPDRDQKIWKELRCRIKSYFRRHWPGMLVVFLATLGFALLLISLWPHFHDGNLHWHWRNPFEAIAYY